MEQNKCDNCLCNLKFCEAECCKQFRLKIPRTRLFKGQTIYFKEEDESMRYYYKVHGCEVIGENIVVKLNKFKKDGNLLYVYQTCKMLDENNMCKLHNSPLQPKVCKYPNKDDGIGDEKIYLTPRCIYGNNN